MVIESVLVFGVAVALPLWLLVEELLHREVSRAAKPVRPVAPARVPASEAA